MDHTECPRDDIVAIGRAARLSVLMAVIIFLGLPSGLKGQVDTSDRRLWGLRETASLLDDVLRLPENKDELRWLFAPTMQVGEHRESLGLTAGAVANYGMPIPLQVIVSYQRLRSAREDSDQIGLKSKLILVQEVPALAVFTDVGRRTRSHSWGEVGAAAEFCFLGWLALGAELSSAWVVPDDGTVSQLFVVGFGARAEPGSATMVSVDFRTDPEMGLEDEVGVAVTHVLLSNGEQNLVGAASLASRGGIFLGLGIIF